MREILESEYIKAKQLIEEQNKIVDIYLKQKECACVNKVETSEYNTFPYGESFYFEQCVDCGKKHNFKIL